MSSLKTVCVYCGSSDQTDEVYLRAAQAMGEALSERGLGLIFGAGKTGMMGRVADAVLANGGQAIGVIPKIFETPELMHNDLSELHVVESMHARKAMMMELSDALVALPGGFGTFEELFEALTWSQIGLHHKPIGVLNIDNYFTPLLDLIEHAREQGFIYSEHRQLLISETQPQDLLDRLSSYHPPDGLDRWVHRKEVK